MLIMARHIPRPTEFLLTIPLYTKTPYAGIESWEIVELLYYKGTYDSYCQKCQRESTFQVRVKERPPGFTRSQRQQMLGAQAGTKSALPPISIGVHYVHSYCTRHPAHDQVFIFYIDQIVERDSKGKSKTVQTIEKIGQQPSYGDLHISEVKRYRQVLTKTQLGELSRAFGLASHDIGIGSYVYLRRIFEALVEEAHQQAVTDSLWNEEAYRRSRMSERIDILKGHLPTFLVEHSSMYSLLSKGVHELTEDECLRHFDTIRIGIELILDEKIRQKEQAEKERAASLAIQKAIGDTNA